MIIQISKRKGLFFVWTFCLLFFPPIISIPTIVLIGIWSWIFIILNYRRLTVNFIYKDIFVLFLFLCAIDIYLCIISLLYDGRIDNGLGSVIYLTIFGFPSAVAYALCVDKYGYSIEDVVKFMISAGVTQGIIAIVTLFSYPIQSIFVSKLYYVMDHEVADYWRTKRLYGWATGMTYSMPILDATVGLLAVLYSIKKKNKYFLFAPIIWMAGILNARNSMVVIIIGFFCILFSVNYIYSAERKRILKAVLIIILFVLLVIISIRFIGNDSLDRWIKNGVSEIYNLLLGEKTGYFASIGIESNTLEVPPNIFTGYGFVGTRSDVGYIRDLWLGGIVYSSLIYVFFIICNYKLKKKILQADKYLSRAVFLFFLLTFAIVNIKGQIFTCNEFAVFFFAWVFIIGYSRRGNINYGNC